MSDNKGPHAKTGRAGAQLDALKAAEALLWSYDVGAKCFDFSGDTASLGLQGHMDLDAFSELLEPGEGDRLELALQSLQVRTAQPGAAAVQCLLRLRDRRLICLKGRTAARDRVLGVLTRLEPDLGLPQPGSGQPAHTDGLTGLLNRQGFLAAAAGRLTHPGEYDLVVADLNRFRRLNEALGHERADIVLELLALRLREVFAPDTLLARVGEDEFAVLTQRGFPRVSERMRSALERPINVAGFDIQPTFSMGAVAADGGGQALEAAELLRRAEMAVEAAQLKGAGGVAAYKRDLESDGLTRLALEAELRKAFVSGEIHPWYQPVVDLATSRVAGFEALARWVHPKRGVIPPDHFLGAVRDLGMMTDLGTIMIKAAVSLLVRWREAYRLPPGFFISVNLSAAEIERLHLVEDVSRLIRDNGLPNGMLKLEVTESDVMRDPQASAQVLQALRDAGAGIAVDDFGTGFSSLSYLARLPFDTLKIDRSFVNTMKCEASSEKIVRSILTLGRDLDLAVVAEGVEDMALAGRLAALGCQMGQGWGFAKALKVAEAEAYLARALGGSPQALTA